MWFGFFFKRRKEKESKTERNKKRKKKRSRQERVQEISSFFSQKNTAHFISKSQNIFWPHRKPPSEDAPRPILWSISYALPRCWNPGNGRAEPGLSLLGQMIGRRSRHRKEGRGKTDGGGRGGGENGCTKREGRDYFGAENRSSRPGGSPKTDARGRKAACSFCEKSEQNKIKGRPKPREELLEEIQERRSKEKRKKEKKEKEFKALLFPPSSSLSSLSLLFYLFVEILRDEKKKESCFFLFVFLLLVDFLALKKKCRTAWNGLPFLPL